LIHRYVRSPKRIDPTTAYVFLGGSRDDNNWSDEWDEKLGKEIMERCCALAPELGRPEDLQVISKNIGLRRKFILLEGDEWVLEGSC
jgi:D-amino-acid oxidase